MNSTLVDIRSSDIMPYSTFNSSIPVTSMATLQATVFSSISYEYTSSYTPNTMLYTSIKAIRDNLRSLGMEYVLGLLEPLVYSRDALSGIEGFVDLVELASLIHWLESLGFKVSSASQVDDVESGEVQFIALFIEGCGWEEWDRIDKLVKEQLVEEGFENLASRVVLVCKEGFETISRPRVS